MKMKIIKVLIVDDDDEFFKEAAQRLGSIYSVAQANSAEIARERLITLRQGFDVVILDMNLRRTEDAPVDSDRCGGLKLLKMLNPRQASRTIYLTRYLDPKGVTEAAGAGCRYFMFKSLKESKDDEGRKEGVFYETLKVYIDAIGKSKKFRYRLGITVVVSLAILFGVVLASLGKSSIAGLVISTMGVVLNLLSFYPRSLR